MAFSDELRALKRDLKDAHIPVDEVLAIARVNRSTWTRWASHHTPRLDRWARVCEAAEGLLAQHRSANEMGRREDLAA